MMVKISIIWIIGLAIALTSGLTTMGAIAKYKAPELAITLSPINGFAIESVVSKSIKTSIGENGGKFPDNMDSRIAEFARHAFIAEPITPSAIAVIALHQAPPNKQRLMNKALALSRRQPLVTAWMIADSGARSDLTGLLHNYDTILRTSTSAASVIIPLIVDTLVNDKFVTPLASVLNKQPPWAYQFWEAVDSNPEAIGNAARLRKMLYKPNESDHIFRDAKLIRALVRNQQFETAESLYHLLVGKKDAGFLINNGSFETEPEYFPIDWQLFSTGGYGAVVTDGMLKISAIPNSGGLLARQLIKLPAQVIRVEIKLSGPIPDNAQIIISLRCAQEIKNAAQITRIPLEQQIENLKIDNSNSVCNFYWLDINGHASENGNGFDTNLESINIVPL